MELWGWQHSRVEDVAAGPGPSERTGDPATKNQNQLHLLIGPTPAVLGRGDTKEPPSDEERWREGPMWGTTSLRSLRFYKMRKSMWGLPAVQAWLARCPGARGVTSDPHPGEGHWAEAEVGRAGAEAPSHAHGHPWGVLQRKERRAGAGSVLV